MPPILIDDPTLTPSPKRKRPDETPLPKKQSPTRLITTIPSSPLPVDEDSIAGSPRTKVAYRFKGLQLEGAGEPTFELGGLPAPGDAMDEDTVANKRVRVSENGELEIPETPQGPAATASVVSTSLVESRVEALMGEVDPVVFKGVAGRSSASRLTRAYPSINRLADSKSRSRKRTGTPPLSWPAGDDGNGDGDLEATGIVDADRAALTWHGHEITGHHPDDSDDDGEGINGIGFKPTPAIAYARAEMRRRQLAEYRTRESKEARARRSERRRGSVGNGSASAREEAARRVRFLEVEASSMITTS